MRAALSAATLFLLASSVLAQDNSPARELYDLKGDVLGMSLEEWTERHGGCGGPRLYQRGGVGTQRCALDTTVAGENAYVEYSFNVDGNETLDGLFLIVVNMGGQSSRGSDTLTEWWNVRAALEAKYGPAHGKRYPDSEDLDEVTKFNRPADSWVSGESEILYVAFALSDNMFFDLRYVHWPLYREHRRRENSIRNDDL